MFLSGILNSINLESFIPIIGIFLAFWAYKKSEQNYYESLKRILKSFSAELKYAKNWFGGHYDKNDYDKKHYSPTKQVYPVILEAGKELIRRGVRSNKILTKKYLEVLALFIERTEAFNRATKHQMRLRESNPLIAFNAYQLIKDELNDTYISLTAFELKIESLNKKETNREFSYIKQVKFVNEMIHQDLISTKSRDDSLHFLYTYLDDKTKDVLKNYDNYVPGWIKAKIFLYAGLFFVVYIVLSLFFG